MSHLAGSVKSRGCGGPNKREGRKDATPSLPPITSGRASFTVLTAGFFLLWSLLPRAQVGVEENRDVPLWAWSLVGSALADLLGLPGRSRQSQEIDNMATNLTAKTLAISNAQLLVQKEEYALQRAITKTTRQIDEAR